MAMASLADVLLSTAQMQPVPKPADVRSARSRNRAAAWRRDIALWREFSLGRSRSVREREEIEREYNQRMEQGPDFTQHHGSSTFDEAPLQKIDEEGRRAILRAYDEIRRWSWKNARKPHGQAVSRAYREVLSALLALALRHGRVFPSYDKLADMACCSRSTVYRALQWLKTWGLLTWQRRVKRAASRLGTVVRQTSNAYSIITDLAELGRAVFRRDPECHNRLPSHYTAAGLRNLVNALKTGAPSGGTPMAF
jgi:hypothetical protein